MEHSVPSGGSLVAAVGAATAQFRIHLGAGLDKQLQQFDRHSRHSTGSRCTTLTVLAVLRVTLNLDTLPVGWITMAMRERTVRPRHVELRDRLMEWEYVRP